MNEQERLDRHCGTMAALEGALVLLVGHLAAVGKLNKPAFAADLRRLSELPMKDGAVRLAEQRLLRMIELTE